MQVKNLRKLDSDGRSLENRYWGGTSDLDAFEKFYNDALPGKIFKGYNHDHENVRGQFDKFYSCIKDHPFSEMVYHYGKTYIGVGFVDNTELLLGTFHGDKTKDGPLEYIGIDQNPICVARAKIIYEMMKQDQPGKHIFELWYLSCLSEKALEAMKKAIANILIFDDFIDEDIQTILQFWLDNSISVVDAQAAWFKTCTSSGLYPLANILSEEGRITFSRYKLSGVLDHNSKYATGNPTIFMQPQPLCDTMEHSKDDLFEALGVETQKENDSDNIVEFLLTKCETGIAYLKRKVISGAIKCEYKLMKVDLENAESIQYIKDLKPYQIDWSNLADFYSPKHFLELAKACSVENTGHMAHFMNWPAKVYGVNLMDYGLEKQETYDEILKL